MSDGQGIRMLWDNNMACLSKFTRNYNILIQRIDDESPESLVTPQYEKVKECWLSLEDAHDDFIDAIVQDRQLAIPPRMVASRRRLGVLHMRAHCC